MHDYIRGAFQALVWVRMLLSNVKDLEGLRRAVKEIDDAIEDVEQRAATNFRWRLRAR